MSNVVHAEKQEIENLSKINLINFKKYYHKSQCSYSRTSCLVIY